MSTLKKIFIFSSLGLALLLFLGGIYILIFKPASKNSPASSSDSKSSPEKKLSSSE